MTIKKTAPKKDTITFNDNGKQEEEIKRPSLPKDSKELLDIIVKTCSDAKGMDITALDVKETFGLCDYFVIVSARSDRQVQGICHRILQELDRCKVHPVSAEGLDKGHWALVDCGDIVVHVFYEPVRQEYDLESLWKKAEKVKLNLPDTE